MPKSAIQAGNVGYLMAGIKNASEVKVGDTITHVDKTGRAAGEALKGFEEVKPMVFAGIYPVDTTEYEALRDSMEKLKLNDASLIWEPETSAALGFGFRCGFLGMLHMEIIQERLEKEFNITIITTVPSVQFHIIDKKGMVIHIQAPADMPDPNIIDCIEEPFILAQIITKSEFVGGIMKLCMNRRGIFKNQIYLTADRVELTFELPLAEVVFDFFDKLKTISRGYASLDYELSRFVASNLVKLDILLHNEKVDALSAIVHRENAYERGQVLCKKLKEIIPRHMFEVSIQAAIGTKIIARETVKAMRKNVIAKCYGGDISRKRKLLEKQKKGKKRMRQVGSVEIPQEAFMAVLKLDD
jgi:GTP-binding protein LepA